MCLGQFSSNRSTISMDPPSVRDTDSSLRFTTTLEAMAAQPSWSLRKVFKPQAPVRPGVARKLAGTAKINLNKYWHVLEDLVHVETSFSTKRRASSPRDYEDIGMSNEINENLANERYEILSASTSRSTVAMEVDGSPSPPLVQQPSAPISPSPVPAPRSPPAARVEKRERVPKKAVTPNPLPSRPSRSPLALINGNQRRSSTPAKTLPLSVRKSPVTKSPVTPKSPMTALTENFQRHLYNRI